MASLTLQVNTEGSKTTNYFTAITLLFLAFALLFTLLWSCMCHWYNDQVSTYCHQCC
jgi:hypothetical protein